MPLKSDPRRLPRRNHYQEGAGLLVLATQGGRPPTPAVTTGPTTASTAHSTAIPRPSRSTGHPSAIWASRTCPRSRRLQSSPPSSLPREYHLPRGNLSEPFVMRDPLSD